MAELISVIVPVYKVEKYLHRCIDSILIQTYRNLEIILIDDGSPDCCGEICDEYAKKDKRVKVVHQINQGVSAARNKGIEVSTGEFISFVDSDDYIDKTYIETLYNNINGYDIVSCNFKVIYSDNSLKIRDYDMPNKVIVRSTKRDLFSDSLGTMAYAYVVWGKLFRKSIIEKVKFREQAYSEDALFVREVFLYCKNIKLIPYDGYNYFINECNVTEDKTRDMEKLLGTLKMLSFTLEACIRNGIDIDYEILKLKIKNTVKGMIKHSLKHRKKISAETKETIINSLNMINSKNIAGYLYKICFICIIQITNIINKTC